MSAAPTDRQIAIGLRRCAWELRQAHSTKCFPTTVHVGRPDAEVCSWIVDVPSDRLDRGLCHEVGAALISRLMATGSAPVGAWITRPGVALPHDHDQVWLEPLRSALLSAQIRPSLIAVVTRFGWYDPYADRGVAWKRLRLRESRD